MATLTDPLGQTLRDSHDVMGNLIRRSDARGHATDYTWDAAGHLQTLTLGGGSSIRIDSRQWTAPRQVSLPGATRSHHYDALLRPQRTVLEQGAAGRGTK